MFSFLSCADSCGDFISYFHRAREKGISIYLYNGMVLSTLGISPCDFGFGFTKKSRTNGNNCPYSSSNECRTLVAFPTHQLLRDLFLRDQGRHLISRAIATCVCLLTIFLITHILMNGHIQKWRCDHWR